ncbi:MAG: UDP-3-O-(3-hydroxymyristoyl)glucosamine N-acyltransferase [Rickettsiales bacterium]
MINHNFYYKKLSHISLKEIADKYNLELRGEDKVVHNLNNIVAAKSDELCFLTNITYLGLLKETKAEACIISKEFLSKALEYNNKISYLISGEAYNLLAKILQDFYSTNNNIKDIAPTAHIAKTATIGKNVNIAHNVYIADNVKLGNNVTIYPFTYIADNVVIGDNSVIGANCAISYALIGNNVEIASGTQIGQDGFGFAQDGSVFNKVIQLGLVIIEDNVSLGSNVAIDRGSLENTIIGKGTKIDNLVQIAHNVKIGENCLIAAQTGIAGSTKIDDYVVFGGQVGVAGHLNIGAHNRFAAQSGVTKNIAKKSGDFYSMPAKPKKEWQREQIMLRKLTKEYFNND